MAPRLLIILLLATGRVLAAPYTVRLDPGVASIGLTVYAMGLFPIPGTYRRFEGTIRLDGADDHACAIDVVIEQASLTMADADRARRALAPDMLDAGRYPTMEFHGACTAEGAAGTLVLHGRRNPLALTLRRTATARGIAIAAEGRLARRDFGIDGMPHLLGQTILVRVAIALPAAPAVPLAGTAPARLR